MWSTLNIRVKYLLLMALVFPALSFSAECRLNVELSEPVVRGRAHVSSVCVIDKDGGLKRLDLIYDLDRFEIYLKHAKKKTFIEKVGASFDPILIGSADKIRFLPIALQPHRSQGMILFVSSRRSVAGGGGGQCGSGSEDYLNALDVSGRTPRVVGSFLIGSCLDNIELSDNSSFAAFKSFWIDGERLAIKFLSYDDRCEGMLVAKLDVAARRLRFYPSQDGIDK